MTPPNTDHVCTQEEKIDELTTNFDKLDTTINGSEGLVAQVKSLVQIVTPMAGDVKTATEFILRTKERERLQKEENDRRNKSLNTWVSIAVVVVALGSLIVAIYALKKGVPPTL